MILLIQITHVDRPVPDLMKMSVILFSGDRISADHQCIIHAVEQIADIRQDKAAVPVKRQPFELLFMHCGRSVRCLYLQQNR